eukprot:TRINITY_DN1226_c0_g2_i1.p1 TRINITY_DN1226_c0_g2~~TRINITY_DN1226_c0_g2_i1.p1  ORF type:complete len:637 (-),score=200.72 TRINITY_DN1226_c0_g2_i1:47-1915(-)
MEAACKRLLRKAHKKGWDVGELFAVLHHAEVEQQLAAAAALEQKQVLPVREEEKEPKEQERERERPRKQAEERQALQEENELKEKEKEKEKEKAKEKEKEKEKEMEKERQKREREEQVRKEKERDEKERKEQQRERDENDRRERVRDDKERKEKEQKEKEEKERREKEQREKEEKERKDKDQQREREDKERREKEQREREEKERGEKEQEQQRAREAQAQAEARAQAAQPQAPRVPPKPSKPLGLGFPPAAPISSAATPRTTFPRSTGTLPTAASAPANAGGTPPPQQVPSKPLTGVAAARARFMTLQSVESAPATPTRTSPASNPNRRSVSCMAEIFQKTPAGQASPKEQVLPHSNGVIASRKDNFLHSSPVAQEKPVRAVGRLSVNMGGKINVGLLAPQQPGHFSAYKQQQKLLTACCVCGADDPIVPTVPLGCGHATHAECMGARLHNLPTNGMRLRTVKAKCDHCKQWISGPQWDAQVAPFKDLCEPLCTALEAAEQAPLDDLAMCLCYRCGKAYFGGTKASLGEAADDDYDEPLEDRVCAECAGGAEACSTHGIEFATFKCRYCCQVACWLSGDAHLCEACHQDNNQSAKPCDCGGSHAPNGSEQFLGCALCLGLAK